MSMLTVRLEGDIQGVLGAASQTLGGAAKLKSQAEKQFGTIVSKIAAQEASRVYWIKQGRVKKAVQRRNAMVIIRGKRQNVSDFRMSPSKPGVRRKNGIKAAVMREGGMKSIRQGFVMAGKNSGKILGMQRTGHARGAIRALIAPAVPQLLENPDVQAGIESRVRNEALGALSLWAARKIQPRR